MSTRQPPNLNRRLRLDTRTRLPDGAGGYSESWTALGTLWAALQAAGGARTGAAPVASRSQRLRAILRALPMGHPLRPHPGQRLVEGTRVFQILAVIEDDNRGRYLRCDLLEEAVL